MSDQNKPETAQQTEDLNEEQMSADAAQEETDTGNGQEPDGQPEAETAEEEPGAEDGQEQDASQEIEKEETGAEPEETETRKGFFSRRNKKDKKDTQIEELTDRVKRQMAEFDNYRKRTEKEKAAMFEVGAKSVIEKLLPVIDNFERGLAAVPEGTEDPYVEGMEKIYKQMMTMLEGLDVKPIEAVGKEFDPNFHNAVMHVEDDTLGENIVAEELQKGYLYRDSVVRHSMVKVAN